MTLNSAPTTPSIQSSSHRGWNSPLYRNAFALMLNTGITAILGVAYWLVAARFYSVSEVGAGSALITTMILISSLTQLNFVQVLMRFLPKAGSQSRRLVIAAYSITTFLAISVATIAVAIAGLISEPGDAFHLNTLESVWFVLATAAWSLFCLQDGALTALRQSKWLPVENGLYSAGKLAAVAIFAATTGAMGLFLSWTIPLIPALLLVNHFLFRKFLNRQITGETILQRKPITKFIAGDYIGNVAAQFTTTLMPLIVIAALDSTANGHYYVAQIVVSMLDLIAINLAASLTVEGSHDQSRTRDLASDVMKKTLVIVVSAALLIGTLSPFVLSIFGSEYADNSTTLLRLLLVASIPRALLAIYASLCRIDHQTYKAGLAQVTQVALLVTLSLILMPGMGINGIGVAAIISQFVVGLFVVPSLIRAVRHG